VLSSHIVGDLSSQTIKRIDRRSGSITTIIGKSGSTPADGSSSTAVFKQPYAACTGGDNTTLFVVDRV
jgi:hypothetical protein